MQKILARTDSSSALGWLYKAFFSEAQPAHDVVAQKLARILLDNDSALYSQHIRGKYNVVADALSRDFHLLEAHLILFLQTIFPYRHPKL